MQIKVVTYLSVLVLLTACGGGGGGNDGGEPVTVSGVVTYDFIPHGDGGSLDYANISRRSVRGASVDVLDSGDRVLASGKTDATGAYNITTTGNTRVRIRVSAELERSGSPSWQVRVTDNTRNNALYTMEGDLINSGSSDSIRNLHANSGWTGSAYGDERVAAPFAILDSVYEAIQLVLEADANTSLSPVELRWSVNNRAISGNPAVGNIGTSFFDGSNIFILGDEDNDTDEHDRTVIQHEFAHFLEFDIARSDSIGGVHSLQTVTDFRVAFSEGYANAFAAIASGTGVYQDSAGPQQASGFSFSLEANSAGNLGWFSENSVGQIVYDIYDSSSDGDDGISLGYEPIHDTMTSIDYRQNSALTSIYLFAELLSSRVGANEAAGIEDLLRAQQIFGTDAYGSGETNDGGLAVSLPVYSQLAPGETINLCSGQSGGSYNGLDVRRFIRVDLAAQGDYSVSAVKTLGGNDRDPDFVISRNGEVVANLDSSAIDQEIVDNLSLAAGNYIFEFFDFCNVGNNCVGGTSCFDVSID